MKSTTNTPIELDFQSANPATLRAQRASADSKGYQSIKTFTSYSFDKNILVPASAFRFTAPGVSKAVRTAIRSGDIVELFVVRPDGEKEQIATGFVDETDTHVSTSSVEYVITGRDTMGQLVDNAALDAQNKMIFLESGTLTDVLELLLENTRMRQDYWDQGTPNGKLLFQTNPQETKINALQRYLEFTNCLVWCAPGGEVIIGKPNFAQAHSGSLVIKRSDPSHNNAVEARSRRNLNSAIRQIVTQLSGLDKINPAPFTLENAEKDMRPVIPTLVGRSVFRTFSYGQGTDTVNTVKQVGTSGGFVDIGRALSAREVARDNMKILDVEIVVRGHTNDRGRPYNIDQIYDVVIEDDDVAEPMYVYACTYNLTPDHGRMTTLRLCRLGTIVGDAEQLTRRTQQ